MATGAVSMLLRRVFDGSITMHELEIERRPYHRNCECALHKPKGLVGSNSCSRWRKLSFPNKQELARHCPLSLSSLSASSLASKFSSESSVLSELLNRSNKEERMRLFWKDDDKQSVNDQGSLKLTYC